MQHPRNWRNAMDQISGLPTITSGRAFHDFDNAVATVIDRLLKPGDILLFRCISNARNAVVYAQNVLGFPAEACLFDHAALYIGNKTICESRPLDGVCIRSISKRATKRQICILRPTQISDELRKDVALWAVSQTGKAYDYNACYRLISGSMKHLRPERGSYLDEDLKPFAIPADIVLQKLNKKPKDDPNWDIDAQLVGGELVREDLIEEENLVQRFICSNLVAKAYFSVLGRRSPMIMQIEDYNIPITTPAEIYINPNLEDISSAVNQEPARIYRLTPR